MGFFLNMELLFTWISENMSSFFSKLNILAWICIFKKETGKIGMEELFD